MTKMDHLTRYLVDPRRAVLDNDAERLLREFFRLVHRGAIERELDAFLRENPVVLGLASRMFRAGHHGCWVIPQLEIKPKTLDGNPGLIPDYVVGARSSDGITWWVLELKGPREQLYVEREGRILESPAHLAARAQLEGYLDWCDANASHLRDVLRLPEFSRPRGVLVMGRGKEMEKDPRKQEKKKQANRRHPDIEVRTWDAFLREILELVTLDSRGSYFKTMDINLLLSVDVDEEYMSEK